MLDLEIKYSPLVKKAIEYGAVIISYIDKRTGEIVEAEAPIGLVNRCINGQENNSTNTSVHRGIVKALKQDVIIKREFKGFVPPGGGPRSAIMRFSKASQRRLKLSVRNASHNLKYMVTLTYPNEFPTDGRKVKRDWIAMRHVLTRMEVCGVMVLEFQERGAPHFHLLINDIKLDKKAISSAWYRIVGSQDKKHLKAGTSVEKLKNMHAAESYVSKFTHSYMAKFEQKGVPEEYQSVGRFWSRFGKLKVESEIIAQGPLNEVAPLIRTLRHAYVAKRKKYTNRKFRDNGRFSWVAWGVASIIKIQK